MAAEKVLILDDDVDVRATLSGILKARGYEPIVAATPEEALEGLARRPGVALIDVQLQESSGLDVMREIKTRAPDVECIVLTGHTTRATIIEAINLGAYGYLEKPYGMDQLRLMVRRALEKRAARRALVEQERYFRSLLHNIHEDILVIDADYHIVDVNHERLITTGQRRDEVIGRRCYEVLHQHDAPCDQHGQPCHLQQVFATGEPRNYSHRRA